MTRQRTTPIVVFLLALLVDASNVTWSAQADLAARIETADGRASVIERRALSVDAAVLSNGPDIAANVQLEIDVIADPPLATVPALLGITPASTLCTGHLRELDDVHAALVCVPTQAVLGVAREILQERIPIVECAQLTGTALADHWQALDAAAEHHRVKAVVGAGWEPGVFTLFEQAFALLIPKGENHLSRRPGASLHHSAAVQSIAGVSAALASEYESASGIKQRYVYVECARDADVDHIKQAIVSDPLFAGEETLVFPVDSIAALEQTGHGIVFERRGTAGSAIHETLMLEGRFDAVALAARVMLDGARSLAWVKPGAHAYLLAQSSAGRR